MVRAAERISSAIWAVNVLPGMHFQLEKLTKAKQM